MSLISDPDYVIHNLRLNYLRHVDDPYGPRIISISQKHCANPLVVATGLDDPEQWPELRVPASPILAAIDWSLPNGSLSTTPPIASGSGDGPNFGATGLKHSETIYGGSRTGGAGMRVSGRYASNTPRARGLGLETADVGSPASSQIARVRSDSAPTPSTPSTTTTNHLLVTSASPEGSDDFPQATPKRRGSAGTVLTRFTTDNGRPQISNPIGAPPAVPGVNGLSLALSSTTPSPAPANTAVLPASFHAPIFARAAEMEARRRERMRARLPLNRPAAAASQPQPTTSPHTPSAAIVSRAVDEIETPKSITTVDSPTVSDEDVDAEDEDEDEDDEDEFRVASTDAVERESIRSGPHEDEFDPPDLLRADSGDRPLPTSVPSDDLSIPSQPSLQSVLSTSQSSAFATGSSQLQVAGQLGNRSRLSPVTENGFDEPRTSNNPESEDEILGKMGSPPEESFFDSAQPSSPQDIVLSVMVSSASEKSVRSGGVLSPVPRPVSISGFGRGGHAKSSRVDKEAGPSQVEPPKSKPSPVPQFIFTKRAIPPRTQNSALTAQLASQFMPSDNPFTDLYAAVSGRAEPNSVSLSLYFPQSRQNRGRPLQVTVRKDATVEEVVGFGLWAYWDKSWEPRLDEGLSPEGRSTNGDKERETRLSTIGWCLRMVEEDGEPDEDFPALDRSRVISKFSFNAYAICEANDDQVKQNEVDNAAIVRRPSRLTATKRQNTLGALSVPELKPGTSVVTSSGITALANTAGLSGLVGPPVFLRVRMAATDAPHFSTTIHTTSDTYLADVLEAVCRKRRLPSPKDWGLMTSDMTIAIPLDRTVASLEGKFSLVLVSRSYLQENGFLAQRWKTTDPNASIYHAMADTNEGKGNAETDFTAGYKKFNVYRKMPVLGRHERTLAIDGHYIHILPHNTTRAFAGSSKTSSHHITAVLSCKQSRKVPQTVKLTVQKDGVEKRYELEAENAKEAAEIVSSIKDLQKSYQLERNGALPRGGKARRSRVVA